MAESRPESGSPDSCPDCCVQLSWFYPTQRRSLQGKGDWRALRDRTKSAWGKGQPSLTGLLRGAPSFHSSSRDRGNISFPINQPRWYLSTISVCPPACLWEHLFLICTEAPFVLAAALTPGVVPLSIRAWSKAARWNTEHLVIFDFQRDN